MIMKEKIKDTYITYRSEFAKIVWPSRPELIRKTITVVVISGIFGVYIAGLDAILAQIFTTLVGFMG
jgi:preprotein translocase subunit SecE